MTTRMNWGARALMVFVMCVVAGCATGCNAGMQGTAPAVMGITGVQGTVFGGRGPISGAQIKLYAAFVNSNQTTPTYSGSNTDLMAGTTPVAGGTLTSVTGNFNITGDYTCAAGQQLYIVALGGDTGGGGANPQAALMAALGDCSTLTAGTRSIAINEVTTVAATTALAPFMSSYTSVGTSYGNNAGMVHAFANADKLVNVSTGLAGGAGLPANVTVPTTEMYTLANVLAACVNTTGGAAPGGVSDGTHCGDLFADVAPGGVTPTETIGLALAIAKNPTLNVSNEFIYNSPVSSPYTPSLQSAPNDWTMAISYSGFSTPTAAVVDAGGNIWVANGTGNSVTMLAQNGKTRATYTGNGLTTPAAIALDASGNVWVANQGGSTVSAFTAGGAAIASSPFTVGTSPSSLAFDAAGTLWVANAGSNSVTELPISAGPVVGSATTVSTGVSAPAAIVINAK